MVTHGSGDSTDPDRPPLEGDGRPTAGTIASMTEGWNYLFGKAFKDYAEEGTRPPRLLSPVMLRESTCF